MSTTTITKSETALPPYFKPIIESQACGRDGSDFDPKKHLAFKQPSKVISMKELGYDEGTGISPVAVSEPFPLFSPEAVQQMRSEIFSKDVMDNCQYRSNLAACQLRGYSAKYAPFVHDAWHNPETLKIISRTAGVDLIPCMDFEIGHINVSVKSEEQTKEELAAIDHQRRFFDEDEGIAGCPWEDDKPVVGWHTDSYPFVCVLMLSDCTNMVGGETALRTGTGEIMKVRGPDMGCAVILQGRYIHHQALRALGAQERITMVTSFRPKSPHLSDDAMLATVRPISDLSELYYQFGEYRLEIMEQRIRHELKVLRDRRRTGKKFDTKSFKRFLATQEQFLGHTNHELIEDDKVISGWIDEVKFDDDAKSTDDVERSVKRKKQT